MDLPANTPVTNRSVPACTVIPVLVYEDVSQAVDWLCAAFGFTERLRAGNHRAQLIVGDGAVILSERRTGQGLDSPDAASFQPPRPNEVSHSILVHVEDADRHYERAREHGARILHPPTDYLYGERQYTAEDLGSHRWTFSQSIADIDPSDVGCNRGQERKCIVFQRWKTTNRRPTMMSTDRPRSEPIKTSIAPWLSVSRATEAVDYYKAAFGAVERYRLEDDEGSVVVAQLAIEGADFWLQEDVDSSPESLDRRSIRMILTVDDPDAMFAQAIAAGATEVFAVSEEHGWRIGRIADPFGHHWEIGKPLR